MGKITIHKKPLCIIPARGGSKRLPRKNIALLRNKPLLAYAIEAAEKSNAFDLICVSSEDDEILETAEKYGAHLALRRRPHLADDRTQVKHVCLDVLDELESQGDIFSEFGVLLTTNPLRTAEDITAAYQVFTSNDADTLMSLVAYAHPPQRALTIRDQQVKPYLGNKFMKQTQRLVPLYRHDGSIILVKTEIFRQEKEFYGANVMPYIIPEERSVDIDNPLDLEWAEFLLSRRQKSRMGEVSRGEIR